VGIATGGVFGFLAKKLTRSDASPKTKVGIAVGAAALNLTALVGLGMLAPHAAAWVLLKYLSPGLVTTAGSVLSYAIAEPGIHVEHDVQKTRADAADERYKA
jgi:hypothetical protein